MTTRTITSISEKPSTASVASFLCVIRGIEEPRAITKIAKGHRSGKNKVSSLGARGRSQAGASIQPGNPEHFLDGRHPSPNLVEPAFPEGPHAQGHRLLADVDGVGA